MKHKPTRKIVLKFALLFLEYDFPQYAFKVIDENQPFFSKFEYKHFERMQFQYYYNNRDEKTIESKLENKIKMTEMLKKFIFLIK